MHPELVDLIDTQVVVARVLEGLQVIGRNSMDAHLRQIRRGGLQSVALQVAYESGIDAMNPELGDFSRAEIVPGGFQVAQESRVDAMDAKLNVVLGVEVLISGLARLSNIGQI